MLSSFLSDYFSLNSADHQTGTIHVSTHRLFNIDSRNQFSNSFTLDLSFATPTEYYAGLFKSSPKITLHLSVEHSLQDTLPSNGVENPFMSWMCEVCNYRTLRD